MNMVMIASRQEVNYILHKTIGDHAIFKRDGSLANGVEICTRPASIDIHLSAMEKFMNNQKLQDNLQVKASCGMHVHIDRRQMSPLTLGKLIKFMQEAKNKAFLEAIAERKESTYAKLGNDLGVTSYHRGQASVERYLGVNVQNQNTAEIRIFRTPNTQEKIQKNLEFVSALSQFIHPANSGINNLLHTDFLQYVKENRSTYKQLFKFCQATF